MSGLVSWTLPRPAVMPLVVRRVTRVPPTEANALASRGDACHVCHRMTSAFFPGSPGPEPQESGR